MLTSEYEPLVLMDTSGLLFFKKFDEEFDIAVKIRVFDGLTWTSEYVDP